MSQITSTWTKREAFGLHRELGSTLNQLMQKYGYSLPLRTGQTSASPVKKLASAIVKLSDYYQQDSSAVRSPTGPRRTSPWSEPWACAAYLAYFLPFNILRLMSVFAEGSVLGFFADIGEVWDFGSGPATALIAWQAVQARSRPSAPVPAPPRWNNIEPALQAQQLGTKLLSELRLAPATWFSRLPERADSQLRPTRRNGKVALLSYVLNELDHRPRSFSNWLTSHEALVVVEPSTREHGRALQTFRGELISAGYHIWAPCTHQRQCPLLAQSQRDWCHDRIAVESPDWLAHLEEHLPMRNKTLTFSYLLASRRPPPGKLNELARTVGDQLPERGKTRQMICRGPEREFLSWLHRDGEVPLLPRGALVRLPETLTKKGSELRVQRDSP